jgi:hypothetical protein
VLQTGFVVLLERRCVDFDALGFNDIPDLNHTVSRSTIEPWWD